MREERLNVYADWKLTVRDVATREVLEVIEQTNIVTNVGKTMFLNRLFGLGGSAVIALGLGSGNPTPALADTRLNTELIAGGGGVRLALTNSSLVDLSGSDIQPDSITISGIPYTEYITVMGVMTSGDGNGTCSVQEFGLFDSDVLPGSPTGTSGNMFNHLVLVSAIPKTSSIEIDAQVTIRL